MKTPEELKALMERAANEDWSFAELASLIEHSEACARKMSIAHFCGQPIVCQCSKATV